MLLQANRLGAVAILTKLLSSTSEYAEGRGGAVATVRSWLALPMLQPRTLHSSRAGPHPFLNSCKHTFFLGQPESTLFKRWCPLPA